MAEITLYELAAADDRRFSPFCWRTRLALLHKGVDFTTRGVHFSGIQTVAGGQFKSVPIIHHGDTWLGDSWSILEYLEQAFPQAPTLLGNVEERAFARWITHWTDSQLLGRIFKMIVADIHQALASEDQDYFRSSREQRLGVSLEATLETREALRPKLQWQLEPLRRLLKTQAFLAGNSPRYCDYVVFSAFLWAETISDWPLLRQDDAVISWRDAMYAHLRQLEA